jgi:branched-subunit amino acid ABC-type transport system permease component
VNEYLPFVVFGLVNGSVYALAAMGLVLSYKTSGLFNFGYGAVAAVGAFAFYELHQQRGLPWPLAAVLSVVVFGVLAGLLLEQLARRLAPVPVAARIVGTVGLLLALRQALILLYGDQPRQLAPFLPQGSAFSVGGTNVSWDQLITFLLGAACAAALYLFFTRARLGTAMRAVVDDPLLLDMTGESPARVRRWSWIIGCAFASMAGTLLATRLNLDATLLTLLVIQAFGAASIAAFTSLPVAYLGGLGVGLLQDVSSKEVAGNALLQGLDINMPFIVLFLVLLLSPKGRLKEVGRQVKSRAVTPSTSSWRVQSLTGAAVAAVLVVIPFVVGAKLPIWSTAVPYALVFLSLGLLVRTSGQVSLCQIGFMAVGAAAMGHLSQAGVPWPVALTLAALITVPVGAVIAIPAIRLSGLYLGLATLGFGVLLGNYVYGKSLMFGAGGVQVDRPTLLGLDSDRGYYYAMLAVLALAIGLVLVVERSRLGRLLRALADSPTALTTHGLDVNVTRVIVFCISAGLAGLGGALLGGLSGTVNGDSFPYLNSLVLLAVLAVSGRATVPSALVAVLAFQVVPGYIANATFSSYLQLAFGVAAVVAAVSEGGVRFLRLPHRKSRERLRGPAGARLAPSRHERVPVGVGP